MTDTNKPKDQPQSPGQDAPSPKPPEKKLPPEIKPDDATMMHFQGSQDHRKDSDLIELVEGKESRS